MSRTPEHVSISFIGIPSGDYESFCWDVTAAMFQKVTGRKPERHDRSYFNKPAKLYRLYPNDVLAHLGVGDKEKVEISISVKR